MPADFLINAGIRVSEVHIDPSVARLGNLQSTINRELNRIGRTASQGARGVLSGIIQSLGGDIDAGEIFRIRNIDRAKATLQKTFKDIVPALGESLDKESDLFDKRIAGLFGPGITERITTISRVVQAGVAVDPAKNLLGLLGLPLDFAGSLEEALRLPPFIGKNIRQSLLTRLQSGKISPEQFVDSIGLTGEVHSKTQQRLASLRETIQRFRGDLTKVRDVDRQRVLDILGFDKTADINLAQAFEARGLRLTGRRDVINVLRKEFRSIFDQALRFKGIKPNFFESLLGGDTRRSILRGLKIDPDEFTGTLEQAFRSKGFKGSFSENVKQLGEQLSNIDPRIIARGMNRSITRGIERLDLTRVRHITQQLQDHLKRGVTPPNALLKQATLARRQIVGLQGDIRELFRLRLPDVIGGTAATSVATARKQDLDLLKKAGIELEEASRQATDPAARQQASLRLQEEQRTQIVKQQREIDKVIAKRRKLRNVLADNLRLVRELATLEAARAVARGEITPQQTSAFIEAQVQGRKDSLRTAGVTKALATGDFDDLNNALNQFQQTNRVAKTQISDLRKRVREYIQTQRKAALATDEHSISLQKFGAQSALAIKRYAAYLLPTTGLFAVIAQVRRSITEFGRFEHVQTKLQQILGVTQKQLIPIRDEFRNLGRELGITTSDIAEGGRLLAQAGFGRPTGGESSAQALQDLANASAVLAKAQLAPSFNSIGESAGGLIAILRQFNLTLGDTGRVMDVINQLSKDFAVESKDIIQGVQRGGAIFGQLGGSFEDFAGLFSILRNQTRESAATLGTFFKTAGLRLFREDSVEILRKLDERILLTNNIGDRLRAISKAFGEQGIPGIEKIGIARELVGLRQGGKLIAILKAIGENTAKLDASLLKAAGSIERDVAVRVDDLGVRFKQLGETVNQFFVKALENPIILDSLSAIASAITTVAQAGQQLSGLFGVFAGIGGVLAVRGIPKVARGFAERLGLARVRSGSRLKSGVGTSVESSILTGILHTLERMERDARIKTGNLVVRETGTDPNFVATGVPLGAPAASFRHRAGRRGQGFFGRFRSAARFTSRPGFQGNLLDPFLLRGRERLSGLGRNISENRFALTTAGLAATSGIGFLREFKQPTAAKDIVAGGTGKALLDALFGGATGAFIGSAFGPFGIAVGAAAGATRALKQSFEELDNVTRELNRSILSRFTERLEPGRIAGKTPSDIFAENFEILANRTNLDFSGITEQIIRIFPESVEKELRGVSKGRRAQGILDEISQNLGFTTGPRGTVNLERQSNQALLLLTDAAQAIKRVGDTADFSTIVANLDRVSAENQRNIANEAKKQLGPIAGLFAGFRDTLNLNQFFGLNLGTEAGEIYKEALVEGAKELENFTKETFSNLKVTRNLDAETAIRETVKILSSGIDDEAVKKSIEEYVVGLLSIGKKLGGVASIFTDLKTSAENTSKGVSLLKGALDSALTEFERFTKEIDRIFKENLLTAENLEKLFEGQFIPQLTVSELRIRNPVTIRGELERFNTERRQSGGFIHGPSINKDIVPAMLAPGEFVIRRTSVQKYGTPLLEALNTGSISSEDLDGRTKLNIGGFITNVRQQGDRSASQHFAKFQTGGIVQPVLNRLRQATQFNAGSSVRQTIGGSSVQLHAGGLVTSSVRNLHGGLVKFGEGGGVPPIISNLHSGIVQFRAHDMNVPAFQAGGNVNQNFTRLINFQTSEFAKPQSFGDIDGGTVRFNTENVRLPDLGRGLTVPIQFQSDTGISEFQTGGKVTKKDDRLNLRDNINNKVRGIVNSFQVLRSSLGKVDESIGKQIVSIVQTSRSPIERAVRPVKDVIDDLFVQPKSEILRPVGEKISRGVKTSQFVAPLIAKEFLSGKGQFAKTSEELKRVNLNYNLGGVVNNIQDKGGLLGFNQGGLIPKLPRFQTGGMVSPFLNSFGFAKYQIGGTVSPVQFARYNKGGHIEKTINTLLSNQIAIPFNLGGSVGSLVGYHTGGFVEKGDSRSVSKHRQGGAVPKIKGLIAYEAGGFVDPAVASSLHGLIEYHSGGIVAPTIPDLFGNVQYRTGGFVPIKLHPFNYQRGGRIAGPNIDKDIVPAVLTPGEFVMRRDAVSKYGISFFKALNAANVPLKKLGHFNKGGLVGLQTGGTVHNLKNIESRGTQIESLKLDLSDNAAKIIEDGVGIDASFVGAILDAIKKVETDTQNRRDAIRLANFERQYAEFIEQTKKSIQAEVILPEKPSIEPSSVIDTGIPIIEDILNKLSSDALQALQGLQEQFGQSDLVNTLQSLQKENRVSFLDDLAERRQQRGQRLRILDREEGPQAIKNIDQLVRKLIESPIQLQRKQGDIPAGNNLGIISPFNISSAIVDTITTLSKKNTDPVQAVQDVGDLLDRQIDRRFVPFALDSLAKDLQDFGKIVLGETGGIRIATNEVNEFFDIISRFEKLGTIAGNENLDQYRKDALQLINDIRVLSPEIQKQAGIGNTIQNLLSELDSLDKTQEIIRDLSSKRFKVRAFEEIGRALRAVDAIETESVQPIQQLSVPQQIEKARRKREQDFTAREEILAKGGVDISNLNLRRTLNQVDQARQQEKVGEVINEFYLQAAAKIKDTFKQDIETVFNTLSPAAAEILGDVNREIRSQQERNLQRQQRASNRSNEAKAGTFGGIIHPIAAIIESIIGLIKPIQIPELPPEVTTPQDQIKVLREFLKTANAEQVRILEKFSDNPQFEELERTISALRLAEEKRATSVQEIKIRAKDLKARTSLATGLRSEIATRTPTSPLEQIEHFRTEIIRRVETLGPVVSKLEENLTQAFDLEFTGTLTAKQRRERVSVLQSISEDVAGFTESLAETDDTDIFRKAAAVRESIRRKLTEEIGIEGDTADILIGKFVRADEGEPLGINIEALVKALEEGGQGLREFLENQTGLTALYTAAIKLANLQAEQRNTLIKEEFALQKLANSQLDKYISAQQEFASLQTTLIQKSLELQRLRGNTNEFEALTKAAKFAEQGVETLVDKVNERLLNLGAKELETLIKQGAPEEIVEQRRAQIQHRLVDFTPEGIEAASQRRQQVFQRLLTTEEATRGRDLTSTEFNQFLSDIKEFNQLQADHARNVKLLDNQIQKAGQAADAFGRVLDSVKRRQEVAFGLATQQRQEVQFAEQDLKVFGQALGLDKLGIDRLTSGHLADPQLGPKILEAFAQQAQTFPAHVLQRIVGLADQIGSLGLDIGGGALGSATADTEAFLLALKAATEPLVRSALSGVATERPSGLPPDLGTATRDLINAETKQEQSIKLRQKLVGSELEQLEGQGNTVNRAINTLIERFTNTQEEVAKQNEALRTQVNAMEKGGQLFVDAAGQVRDAALQLADRFADAVNNIPSEIQIVGADVNVNVRLENQEVLTNIQNNIMADVLDQVREELLIWKRTLGL